MANNVTDWTTEFCVILWLPKVLRDVTFIVKCSYAKQKKRDDGHNYFPEARNLLVMGLVTYGWQIM